MKIDEEDLRKRERIKQYETYQNYLEEVDKEEKSEKSAKGEGILKGKKVKKSVAEDSNASQLFQNIMKKTEKK